MRKVFCEVLNKYIELPDRCERIVSFSPAITESLFEMGLGDFVVGVSAFCVRPAEAQKKTKLGSYGSASLEKIKQLNPDVIFTTTGYQREIAFKLSSIFPIYTVPLPYNISSLISLCVEPGYVAGYYEEARKLEENLWLLLGKIDKLDKNITAYIEIDFSNPTTFGAFSYITNSLKIFGVKNVYSEVPQEWIIPNFEELKILDPDIIIYEPKMFRTAKKEEIIDLFEKRGLGNMRAIKNDCLIITPGPYDFLAHHGPSYIKEILPWIINEVKRLMNKVNY